MSYYGRVYQHLKALGLSHRDADAFASNVEKWCADSGREWTVERLKALKLSLVEMLATGEHYKVPPGWATRYNRKGQVVFKDNVIHAVFSQAQVNLKLAENALRVYQVIRHEEVSETQLQKMEKAITSPSNAVEGFTDDCVRQITIRECSFRTRKLVRGKARSAKTLMEMAASPKRSPAIDASGDSLSVTRTRERFEMEPSDIWNLLFRDTKTKALWKEYPHDVARAVIGETMMPFIDTGEEEVSLPAGTLSALQEGGCKVRWIANPHLLYQAFGEPMKVKLQCYTEIVYPEVRVHDQDSGREQVAEWLRQGKVVYCYDCSSFTDRFPLVLQVEILNKLLDSGVISEFDMQAFQLVMEKQWYYRGTKKLYGWEVGQPLGYGPSFALATLTHAALISSLCGDGDWMVVGDDVVIADPEIADKYQFCMISLGVEINKAKSVISPRLGEFLGKLITKDGVNPSTKVKPLNTESQVIKLIEFYGEEFIELLGDNMWRAVLSAYVPTWLGGLGMKPKNLSESKVLSLLDTDKIQRKFLLDEMSEFHNSTQWDSLSASMWVEHKVKLMAPYTDYLDLLGEAEIEHFWGEGVRFNALGVLTDTKHATQWSVPPPPNSFTYLMDKQWFLSKPGSLTSNELRMFNTYGYILPSEQPSSLTTDVWVSFNSQREKMSNDIQYRSSANFFKRPRQAFVEIRRSSSKDYETRGRSHKGNFYGSV